MAALQQVQLGVVRGLLDLQGSQHIGTVLSDSGDALGIRGVVDAEAVALYACRSTSADCGESR